MPVFAQFNFNDTGSNALDSAPAFGDQLGTYRNGAASVGGQAVLDGQDDLVKIFQDPSYQMDRGTLDINFTLADQPLSATQTVLSRDSVGETPGGYRIEVQADGSVVISHETGSGTETFGTEPGFANPGDEIDLSYSWDQGGAGGALQINNATTSDSFSDTVPNTLTMDMGNTDQPWIVGAGQANSDAGSLDNIDQHFAGSVDLFQLSDSVDNYDHARDGYVDGTAGGDLIDTSYTGDSDGDLIDNSDAILGGDSPNDDRVRAGTGDDTVYAGLGDDTIIGGEGADELYGGADRDVFIVGANGDGFGDVIDGNEQGDDFDTLDLTGAGPLHIIYDPDNAENGTVQFFDPDGNVASTLTFTNIENIIPCFTPGTLIATPRGEVPVESLVAGDRVITRDNGIQEIRWVGRKDIGWHDLIANPHLKPVLIRQGSLGHGLPERDMMVSPNHRVLVANDRTALYFDEHEVLVSAKHLVAARGIDAINAVGTSYIHFMCDRHEVVLSNGAWTESFQPGDYTLKGMGNSQRGEIFDLFPELKTHAGLQAYQAARRTLKRHEALLLAR
ncbi:MAG: tandem-95 repeat protein [Cypionkella sp.]|uniref:Hint domain-containing protein n=1 Tax=Cypionkella sp. TaxID=2811411 RepID=UPI00262B4C11|nr:Hint domain-containing protein [Cypionkella sp.]MDB5661073.1 tandem-95 repeat protein [Cypionkella sp.]